MSLNPPLRDWLSQRVWIIGASSGIGAALASLLLRRGAEVVISARSRDALEALAAQAPARTTVVPLDVVAGDFAAAALAAGEVDLVVYCAGHYEAMRATGFDLAAAMRHLDVNYVGALRLLDAVLPALRRRGRGHISFVSSVAGYRGLPLALAYGPSKAALIHLAQTLYMDLRPLHIGVSLINPGFVATPMTASNAFRMPALITPDEAAQAIVRGLEAGRFEIAFPRRFTLPLRALSLLPFGLYQALVRRGTRA